MIKKTLEGITKLLKGVFGKKKDTDTVIYDFDKDEKKRLETIEKLADKHKDTLTTLGDVIDSLPQERVENIDIKFEKLKEVVDNTPKQQTMSIKGQADLILSEAIVLTRYLDNANTWTIAIGATKSEIPNLRSWPIDKEISLEEAFRLFKKSIGEDRYVKGVRKALKVGVSPHMFDGLVSFAYNVGVGGMRNSSLIREINEGVTNKKRLKSLLMRWVKSKNNAGKLVFNKGLYNRRKVEAKLMFDGVYKNKKMLGYVIPVSAKTHKPMYRSKRVYTIDLNKYL